MKKNIVLVVIMFIFSAIQAQNLTEIYSGPSIIDDIAITNDGAIYSVGQKIIIIKDGQTFEYWPPVELFSVFPISANEAWAVGNSAILHYDGSSWSSLTNPAGGCLYRVWGIDSNIYITGRNGTTSFLLKLVNGSFVKKAEMANSLFLGMNGYSQQKIYIAGSYTAPYDNVERPALFVFENDSIIKNNEVFDNESNAGNELETTPSGGFLMSTTDHYYSGSDLYLLLNGSSGVAPYDGLSRAICSDDQDNNKLFLANENGVIIITKDALNGDYTPIISGENCFDVEYVNNEIYILVNRMTIKKLYFDITSINSLRPNSENQTEGQTEFYNLSGQKISGLNKNLPAGIYLKKTGNQVEKIHYLGE